MDLCCPTAAAPMLGSRVKMRVPMHLQPLRLAKALPNRCSQVMCYLSARFACVIVSHLFLHYSIPQWQSSRKSNVEALGMCRFKHFRVARLEPRVVRLRLWCLTFSVPLAREKHASARLIEDCNSSPIHDWLSRPLFGTVAKPQHSQTFLVYCNLARTLHTA